MSWNRVRDTLGAVGVVASLVFVGFEIRANTTQARAAAYQEIGIATAGLHLNLDEWAVRLAVEQQHAARVASWSPEDWHRMFRTWLGTFRIWETLQRQVALGVLDGDAIDAMGFSNTANIAWGSVAFRCFWPAFRQNTSAELIEIMEAAAPPDLPACPVEVVGVTGM
jgi:hypothetical protein